MKGMTQSDAYKRILAMGLLALRDRAPRFDSPRLVQIEAEHLHNIPSLIEDENWLRHDYYYNTERPAYLASLKELGLQGYSDDVPQMYAVPWRALLEHLEAGRPMKSKEEK